MPTTPGLMICTKCLSILGESITRSKTSDNNPGDCTGNNAHNKAGKSFMYP